MAVRIALGAGRGRLARQLLIESLLLSSIGGLLGLGLAHWGITFLVNAVPAAQLANMPYLRSVGINMNILGYTAVISVLSGVIFALVPVFHANKTNLNATLKEGGRSSGHAVRSRLRNALVVAEIALGHAEPLARVAQLLHENGELVAAEAGRGVSRAQAVRQTLADHHEQRVAGGVAEAVVDRLEVVEVEQDDADGFGAQRRLTQVGEDATAVGQTGQREEQAATVARAGQDAGERAG